MNKKVKLLIITQKVDKNDSILGFFHRWIEELAKHYESIIVICLQKGEYNLPSNVRVLSLGKEYGVSRIKYIYRFYKYIWQERKNYDSVFVHMNQEYILLGWKLWKLYGKKIFLWRNHAKGNLATRLAILFSDKVFCTSPQSFTARFKKTKIMPVGIDIDFFKPDSSVQRKPNSILFLGRIAPVKNVDILIEALNALKDRGVEFSATIAGVSANKDTEYEKIIHDKVREYNLENRVKFTGAVSQTEALKLYREHKLYVNLTPSGSMDKTIFEAMACKTSVLVYNKNISELADCFIVGNLDYRILASCIKQSLTALNKKDFYLEGKALHYVSINHSLKNLVNRLDLR